MSKDLELALKIKTTHDGLGDIKATIAELKAAGTETSAWESAASDLSREMLEVAREQSLIDMFVQLKRKTKDSADTLSEAQQKAQQLGKELAATEKPTKKQTEDFKKARDAVKAAADAYQASRVAVQNARTELKSAGVETGNLAAHQVKARKATQDLTARIQLLRDGLQQQAVQAKNTATATAAAAEQNVSSHRKISAGVQSISTQLDGMKKTAIAAFGFSTGTQLIADLKNMADEYTNLSARLKLAVGEGQRFDQGLADIRSTANATGAVLGSVGDLYITLNRSTKELNLSQREVAVLTDTISKSFLVSGSSAQAADAAITQLAQGLQSGVLRGDEFNSVMEQSPRLAQAMTDSLGVTRGELRQMAEDGELSTEVVVRALQAQSAAIAEEAEMMPDTIGRAAQRVKNEFMLAIGEMDSAAGASEKIASYLSGIATNMDAIINTMTLAGEVAAAALLRKYVPAVASASAGMITAAKNGTLFSASMNGVAGSATTASAALGLVKAALPLIAITYTVDQTFKLVCAFNELSDATKNLKKAQQELEDSDARLVAEYQKISEKTGVVIRNMEDLDAALAAGTIEIDHQTNSYVSAAQAAELKAKRDLEAAKAGERMAYTEQQLSERLAEVNKQLQVAVDDNSKLASVMSGSLLDALKNGESGVAAFAIGLRSAEQQGQLTSEQIRTGLSSALDGLSSEERTRFGDAIKVAMDKIAGGAKKTGVTLNQLQSLLDVMYQSAEDNAFKRLGISAEELAGSITKGTNTALQDLALLTGKMAETGIAGDAAARITETAFTNAWRNARTEADRAALTEVLKSWERQGLITAKAVEEIVETTKKQPQALTPVEAAYRRLGITSKAALQSMADELRNAYQTLVDSAAPIEDQKAAFLRYAQTAIAANEGIISTELRLQAIRLGLADELQQLVGDQEQLGDAGEQAGDKTEKGAKKAAEATRDVGAAAKDSERDVQAVGASLAAWFQSVRDEMSALSEQARAAFDNKLGISTAGPVSEMEALQQSIAATREELGKVSIDNLQVFDPTGVNRFKNSVIQAKNETLIAYQEQKLKAMEYINALESGQGVNQAFINQAKNAQQWMSLLGEEDLSQLQSALDSANQKLESMRATAKSVVDGLQDELDRLNGNQEAIAERQYKNKKEEYEAKLKEARAWNDQQTIQYYTKALQLLDQVRSDELKQSREEKRQTAQRQSSTTSESQTHKVQTVEVKIGTRRVEVLANNKDDLLDALEEFGARS